MPGPPRAISRCPGCRAVLRARLRDGEGAERTFDVDAVGRPGTRRAVEVPWSERDERSLRAWLAWSSAITLGLVLVLLALARWLR
ncbi:MAG: hypothetical protein ABW221_03310 [Vicinamibacteria bacterium]